MILAVAVMGTAVAYLKNPEHKAFLLMLPIPFTMAVMAVQKPVDATNVIGLSVTFGYMYLVWLFRMRFRIPIIFSIILAVSIYCLIGWSIARLHPSGDLVFWGAMIWSLGLSLLCIWRMPYRAEPHYRTPLPIWIKFPAIALVAYGICQLKQVLGGFVTVFPMVGLVASYEARHSLWTNARRLPWMLLTMIPFMSVIRLLQGRIGELPALLLAWPVHIATLWVWHIYYTRHHLGDGEDEVDTPPVEAAVAAKSS